MEAVRTCVGCRQRAPRADLVRVTQQAAMLIVDHKAVNPGRGAWFHPVSECLQLAINRRAFSRALKMTEPADVSGLVQSIEKAETMLASK